MADVPMRQLGEALTEATITWWFTRVGDSIADDEQLFEVSTDKAGSVKRSPVSGTLIEILVDKGDTVDLGTVLARIGDARDAQVVVPNEEPAEESAPVEQAPRSKPAPAAGGAIGCDLASTMSDMGTDVTSLVALSRILSGYDTDVTRAVQQSFKKRNIGIKAGVAVSGYEPRKGGGTAVRFGEGETIDVEVVVVSVGRRPNTNDLGLDGTNVQLSDRGASSRSTTASAPTNLTSGRSAIGSPGWHCSTWRSSTASSWSRTSSAKTRFSSITPTCRVAICCHREGRVCRHERRSSRGFWLRRRHLEASLDRQRSRDDRRRH